MEQDKIAKIIKDIRKKHNLTQKELADRLGVTYQAVSKWENEKNIPDIAILKKISDDFNININDLLNGEYSNKKNKNSTVVLGSAILIIGIIIFIITMINLSDKNDNDFNFKTLSTGCGNFTISGSMAYNESKSSIYISEVKYCGGDDTSTYSHIECSLYEEIDNVKTLITSCDSKENTTLEDFLKNTKLSVDNYKQNCKNYVHSELYLEIRATDSNEKSVVYNVPLDLEDNCKF